MIDIELLMSYNELACYRPNDIVVAKLYYNTKREDYLACGIDKKEILSFTLHEDYTEANEAFLDLIDRIK